MRIRWWSVANVRYILRALVLGGLGLCAGCHETYDLPFAPEPTLPTHVGGASEAKMLALQNILQQHGVRVISMGQNYLVSIPSALIFHDESPAIKWSSYALLNDVACYLQQFRKISVHVNAYSNCFISKRRDQALTLSRARAVGDYLWSQNIESRLIFTRGLGSDKPIVESAGLGDQSINSRIEITFRRAVG